MPPAKNQPLRPPIAVEAQRAARLASNVDELGDIDRKLAPYRSLITREEALKKSIRADFVENDAYKTFEARGSRFIAMIGARANERRINLAKLWKEGGAALMKKIATVTLKALEESAPHLVLSVVSVEATGTRSLRVMELGTAEQKAA